MIGELWTSLFWGAVLVGGALFISRRRDPPELQRHEPTEEPGRDLARPTCSTAWLRSRISELADTSLLLLPASVPCFSKLGGDPELPPHIPWPMSDFGPRAFLAQVDLDEVHAAGGPEWLPSHGKLYMFAVPDGFGMPDMVQTIFTSGRDAQSVPTPREVEWRFRERRVGFRRVVSAPSEDWIGVQHHRLIDDDPEPWTSWGARFDAPPSDAMQHRLGGFPNEIQDSQMALICERLRSGLPEPRYEPSVTADLERAANDWRLLLQIDSDPGLGMEWGDAARLYVLIRKDDALSGDFSMTVTLYQSY
jgi:uncharacterized protein YwqG